MRGRLDHGFVISAVCLPERPLIRLAALDTFSPKGRRLCRSPGKSSAPLHRLLLPIAYCLMMIAYCLMMIAPSPGLLNRKPFIFFIIPRTPKIVKHYFSFFEHFFGVFPFFPKNFCSFVREKAKLLLSGKNRFSGSLCGKRACFFAKS